MFIKLCEEKICRFYGQYILSSSAGKFNLNEVGEVVMVTLNLGTL